MSKEFDPRPYSKELRQQFQLRCDRDKRLYVHNTKSGLWTEPADPILEKTLRKTSFKGWGQVHKIQYVREVLADLTSLCYDEQDFPAAPWTCVPFNDGYYDLKEQSFHPFSPRMYFTEKLSVDYKEITTSSKIEKIFADLLPAEKVVDLYELVAYTMLRSYPYQKFFLLYGKGANGKSVFTRILEMLLGSRNVSHVSLSAFQHNRFAGAELHKKFANICSELGYETLTKTDTIKQLTGGDSMQVERKFQHPFHFVNFAKLVFVTNELPPTTDKTNAFYRRLFLIEFSNVFDGEKADRLLTDSIEKEDIEWLAYKCLHVLTDMMGRGFTFTHDDSVNYLMEDYERRSNPFDTFIAEFYEQAGHVSKQDFKEHFTQWLKDQGYRVWDEKRIKNAMEAKGFYGQKLEDDDKRQNCWVGLCRKDTW